MELNLMTTIAANIWLIVGVLSGLFIFTMARLGRMSPRDVVDTVSEHPSRFRIITVFWWAVGIGAPSWWFFFAPAEYHFLGTYVRGVNEWPWILTVGGYLLFGLLWYTSLCGMPKTYSYFSRRWPLITQIVTTTFDGAAKKQASEDIRAVQRRPRDHMDAAVQKHREKVSLQRQLALKWLLAALTDKETGYPYLCACQIKERTLTSEEWSMWRSGKDPDSGEPLSAAKLPRADRVSTRPDQPLNDAQRSFASAVNGGREVAVDEGTSVEFRTFETEDNRKVAWFSVLVGSVVLIAVIAQAFHLPVLIPTAIVLALDILLFKKYLKAALLKVPWYTWGTLAALILAGTYIVIAPAIKWVSNGIPEVDWQTAQNSFATKYQTVVDFLYPPSLPLSEYEVSVSYDITWTKPEGDEVSAAKQEVTRVASQLANFINSLQAAQQVLDKQDSNMLNVHNLIAQDPGEAAGPVRLFLKAVRDWAEVGMSPYDPNQPNPYVGLEQAFVARVDIAVGVGTMPQDKAESLKSAAQAEVRAAGVLYDLVLEVDKLRAYVESVGKDPEKIDPATTNLFLRNIRSYEGALDSEMTIIESLLGTVLEQPYELPRMDGFANSLALALIPREEIAQVAPTPQPTPRLVDPSALMDSMSASVNPQESVTINEVPPQGCAPVGTETVKYTGMVANFMDLVPVTNQFAAQVLGPADNCGGTPFLITVGDGTNTFTSWTVVLTTSFSATPVQGEYYISKVEPTGTTIVKVGDLKGEQVLQTVQVLSK